MLIFLKRHGYAVRLLGGGAGVFAPSLGLPVVRVMRKKRGVRISPFFSALHGRTPCKVGVKAIEFWRRKKGGVDWENCGMERSGMEQFCPLVRFPAEKKLEIAPLRLFVSPAEKKWKLHRSACSFPLPRKNGNCTAPLVRFRPGALLPIRAIR